MNAAANLVDIAKDETASLTERSNARELADLEALYGDDRKSKTSRAYRAGLRELQHSQKQREKRRIMDVIDRGLMDIMSVYRDAIALQTGARRRPGQRGGPRPGRRPRPPLDARSRTSAASTPIFAAREQMMEFNTTPLLALESMMVCAPRSAEARSSYSGRVTPPRTRGTVVAASLARPRALRLRGLLGFLRRPPDVASPRATLTPSPIASTRPARRPPAPDRRRWPGSTGRS